MTEQRPDRAPGYRGALPPRNDALARPWVIAVIAIGLFFLTGVGNIVFLIPNITLF